MGERTDAEMAKQMLGELKEGDTFRTMVYLKDRQVSQLRNKPGSYLRMTVADRTATLSAKKWEDAEEAAAAVRPGTVVAIMGRVGSYQGQVELTVDRIKPWDGEVEWSDYMAAGREDVGRMTARLDELIASLSDETLGAVVRRLLGEGDTRERYLAAPAARGMHGAHLQGLLEHVVRQVEVAEAACAQFPEVRRDLVIAGVLLHDIGKTVELSWGLGIEYTTKGRLLGHTVIGERMVCDAARELGIAEEKVLELRHLLLSHHGVGEYGAPVVPMTAEAAILSSVDNLEAKVTHCLEAMRAGDPDATWTEYDRMEERFWYRGEREEGRMSGDA